MPLPFCRINCHGEQQDDFGKRIDWDTGYNGVALAVHEHTGFDNFVMFASDSRHGHPTVRGFDTIPCSSGGTCSQGPCTDGACLATGTTWGSGVEIYSKPRHPLCARQN
jgi:hypothetical protein